MRRSVLGAVVVGLVALAGSAGGQASREVTVRISESIRGPVVEHSVTGARPVTFRTRGWSCDASVSDSGASRLVAFVECSRGDGVAAVSVVCDERTPAELERLMVRRQDDTRPATIELACRW